MVRRSRIIPVKYFADYSLNHFMVGIPGVIQIPGVIRIIVHYKSVVHKDAKARSCLSHDSILNVMKLSPQRSVLENNFSTIFHTASLYLSRFDLFILTNVNPTVSPAESICSKYTVL